MSIPAVKRLMDVPPTGTRFEHYRDVRGEWRWRLVHSNGNIIADSGEGYVRREDSVKATNRLAGYCRGAKHVTVKD